MCLLLEWRHLQSFAATTPTDFLSHIVASYLFVAESHKHPNFITTNRTQNIYKCAKRKPKFMNSYNTKNDKLNRILNVQK